MVKEKVMMITKKEIKPEKLPSFCSDCEAELNAEEAESPRKNKDGDIICDCCFENQYSHRCPLCEDIFDEDFSENISPKYLLLTKYAAEELGFDPGIYEIIAYPFFADGIVEIHIFKTATKKIADLPSDFNEDDFYSDIFYVCEECGKKLVIENKISKEEQQKLEGSLKHLHQEITEHIHPHVATKIEKIGEGKC